MAIRLRQFLRDSLYSAAIICLVLLAPVIARAAPHAALVMDARTGQILYARNADTRLHPASLTKMLTLYIAFDAIRRGEITLDTPVTIQREAADQPPSKLGLRVGQKIKLRYLIRAAAVKSANDCATAIADAISGSQAAFAKRMTATAKKLGMENSTFRNANGLTLRGHMSTAHDMAILARHLFYDFPQYYNIFSRRKTDAGGTMVYSTNHQFLNSYPGADGIKTGYTVASGFNLVASARHGSKRVIGVIFGSPSPSQRTREMTKLLNLGFAREPANVRVRKPKRPNLDLIAAADMRGKTIRYVTAVKTSPRPQLRPGSTPQPSKQLIASIQDNVDATLGQVMDAADDTAKAAGTDQAAAAQADATVAPVDTSPVPPARPGTALATAQAETPRVNDDDSEGSAAIDTQNTVELTQGAAPARTAVAQAGDIDQVQPTSASDSDAATADDGIVFASTTPRRVPAPEARPEIVTRMSTSGGRDWSINVGRFPSRYKAEKVLLRVALTESTSLRDTLRKVIRRPNGFDANFVGLTQDQADLACARLQARDIQCFSVAPNNS